MIEEREVWACAHWVVRCHGAAAAAFVQERIDALSLTGDATGASVWALVAARLKQLSPDPRTVH